MKELKKIMIFLLLFSAGIFLADRLLGLLLEKVFESNLSGQSGGKVNYYLRKNYEPKLIIMGDSRALNQVNPDSFKINSYNISHAGMDEVFQEALLDLVLAKRKKPEIILLHLDPGFYIEKKNDNNFTDKCMYLRPFYGQSAVLTDYIDNSGTYEKIKFFFSSYKYNNIVFNTLKNRIKKEIPPNKGYDAIPFSDFDAERTKLTATRDTISDTIKLNPLRFVQLVNIIEACRKNGIRLICFTGPVWHEKNISPFQKIDNSIDSVCKKNNVPYLDYSFVKERKTIFGNIDLWHDCFHLNEKGAAVFSGVISRRVDSLIVVPRPRQ